MKDQDRKEMVAHLHRRAECARLEAEMWEIAADSVARFPTEEELDAAAQPFGFPSEAAHQDEAAEAFAAAEESKDAWPEMAR